MDADRPGYCQQMVLASGGDGPGAGVSGGTPGPGGGKRWPRRLVIGVATLVIVAMLAVAGGYGYLHFRLGQIKRVTVAGEASVGSGQPMTILVAGSDSRAGESAAEQQAFGSASEVAGQRSDVILLVHINPATDSASMLSVPRDTLVTLAGSQTQAKINVAFDNGPSQLVQTISDTFGIQINHVVQVTFEGVENIDQAVGGVCMNFPYPARDGSPTGEGNESGLDIPTAGPHVLNGPQALSLIRSRYYQYYEDGEWIPDGAGDLGRIVRQHEFLRALASKALHEARSNPFKANALATDAVHDVTVDKSFSSNSILELVAEMRNLDTSAIPSWTLPTSEANDYGSLGDVLLPEPSLDQAIINQWLSYNAHPAGAPKAKSAPTTTTTLAPSAVTLTILNGSGQSGQAAQAEEGLQSDGFHVSRTGNAPNFGYTSSIVEYGNRGKPAAETVAGFVDGNVVVRADPSLRAHQVELITGSDFEGISAPAGAPSTTTSTPGPAAATTTDTVPPWDPTPCSS